MAKRYLGYGYTNAQGVAKLEYDSEGNALTHSYTGVGAGKVDIVAESGTLQSETYTILDCMFTEINGSGNIDWKNPTTATITKDSSGTSVTASTIGTVSYLQLSTNHSTVYNMKDVSGFVVAFDLISYEGDCFLEVTGNNGSATHWLCTRQFAETGYYEYHFEPTEQYVMVNGTKIGLNTRTLSDYTSSIYVNMDTKNNMKFNNFVIYPI